MILPNTQSPLQTIWSQKAWPKKMQSNASHKSRIVGMRRSDAEEDEFYETNPDDFIILLDQMKRDGIELSHKIWEPSCGHGALSEELSIRGHNVLSSDLIPRGYGNTSDFLFQHTTLDGTKLPSKIRGDIITNPPYKGSIDIQFVERANELVEDGGWVIMLVKTQWFASLGRFLLFQRIGRPNYIYTHHARISIFKAGDRSLGSNNSLDYEWYLWKKGTPGKAERRSIAHPKWASKYPELDILNFVNN
tara:strand:- start:1321 stop:2064 length:744 start_codon:yes stop_codon:yes gene_type:complete